MLSPKEVGYNWLWAYRYDDWLIRFRDLSYPEMKRCGETLGLCDYNHKTIWIQQGMRSTEALVTMQHELAHVFTPGEGHSPVWHEWLEYIQAKKLPESWWVRKKPVPAPVQVVEQDNDLALGLLLGFWLGGR